jgi:hypothetical protein
MPPVDRLPEQANYRDEGCDLSPTCLRCPLPLCRYDLPPKRAGALVRVARLQALLAEGKTADEAAEIMGVCRRTIFRLKQYATMYSTSIPLQLR